MAIEPALVEEGQVEPPVAGTQAAADVAQGGLVTAAAIIGVGNVASRVFGLVRETVIASLFGATGYVSVFRVAATIIQTLYDFLVGGMVSAALVPLFSDLADRADRDELWQVASIVINVIAVGLAATVLLLELFAPQLVWILGAGYDPSLQSAAVQMIRLILPAVFFLGMSGIITGLLYALKRFTFPAFTTAAYNVGIVVVALALTPVLGITSLIVGILVGSALQVLLQVPGLRDMRYHFKVDLAHPALRRIVKLYVPVVGGLGIGVVGVAIDRNLASFTGPQSLAWMTDATVLIQFPLGLVGTAIAFAILPQLSRQTQAAHERKEDGGAGLSDTVAPSAEFQRTLVFGLRLVLFLILPAAVGLFVLAHPIVALLFEHGAFTANDTYWTAMALRFYLIGLPFAAVDQPLVFAFYARKNTVTPNLVAFAGVAIYLVVALALVHSHGMIGLVLANSAQLTGHALIMLWLTQTRLADLNPKVILSAVGKMLAASALMGLVAAGILGLSDQMTVSTWARVLVPGLAGLLTYAFLAWALRLEEGGRVLQIAMSRWRVA